MTTLRNWRVLEDPQEEKNLALRLAKSHHYLWKESWGPNPNKDNEKKKHKKDELSTSYIPKAPFSTALEAKTPSPFTKKGARMDEMMKLFKQVQINLAFLDVIKHVPSYAKFPKDLSTQKRRLKIQIPKKIVFTEQVSVVLMNQLPP